MPIPSGPLARRASRGVLVQHGERKVWVGGDAPVVDATARFDGVELTQEQLRIGPGELAAATVAAEVDAADGLV